MEKNKPSIAKTAMTNLRFISCRGILLSMGLTDSVAPSDTDFTASPTGGIFLAFVNGEHAWTEDSQSGHVPPLDSASAAGVRSHEFQMLALVLAERYKNPVVEGEEDSAGERCVKIRTTDELGKPCAVLFKTGPSRLHPGELQFQVCLKIRE